jgi:hypothetical protein
MKKFDEWFLFREGLEIQFIYPEEDWDQAEVAWQIAKKVNIRPDSTKNPTIIALNDKDDVIGAAFTSWSYDDEISQHLNQPMHRFEFDVVVDPAWQGYEMVGIKLIKAAEKERRELEIMNNLNIYTRLWVVNPKLAKILKSKRYGYDVESEYKDGSAHLVKY